MRPFPFLVSLRLHDLAEVGDFTQEAVDALQETEAILAHSGIVRHDHDGIEEGVDRLGEILEIVDNADVVVRPDEALSCALGGSIGLHQLFLLFRLEKRRIDARFSLRFRRKIRHAHERLHSCRHIGRGKLRSDRLCRKHHAAHIVDVDYGNYFVAMGAALSDEARCIDTAELTDSIERAKTAAAAETRTADFTLFTGKEDYQAFKARHEKDRVRRGDFKSYSGSVYVGIDAGSTTTKICAIGKNKEVLYTSYGSNMGSPLKTVVKEMQDLYSELPAAAKIAGVMTTGYGEKIVKAALHADGGEVETFAHLRAAQEFCPEVTFVLDIGGQDMKCFFVRDGSIGNITLNEACSAGCGSCWTGFSAMSARSIPT